MDDWNYRILSRIFGSDTGNKVHKLLTFAGSKRDVSDPWYSGDFTTAYNDIYLGCSALLEFLKTKLN